MEAMRIPSVDFGLMATTYESLEKKHIKFDVKTNDKHAYNTSTMIFITFHS
jgi:hypothetical protein